MELIESHHDINKELQALKQANDNLKQSKIETVVALSKEMNNLRQMVNTYTPRHPIRQ